VKYLIKQPFGSSNHLELLCDPIILTALVS
jgi:hypothetical protein